MVAERPNPYINSRLVQKVKETGVINFFDIDGTLAMGGEPSDRELYARKKSRAYGELGAFVFITARTPELTMFEREYLNSVNMGFTRPKPRAHKDEDLEYLFQVPLEMLRSFNHVSGGADAIACMGVSVMVAQNGGYVADEEYERHAVGRILCDGHWRALVSEELGSADREGDIVNAFSALEFPKNYEDAEVDVATLPYRFQLDWNNELEWGNKSAVEAYAAVKRRLIKRFGKRPELQISLVDESSPSKGRYTLYVLHKAFSKERMHERIVGQVLKNTGMNPSDLTVNVFGDAPTDLRQLYACGSKFGNTFDGSAVKMNFVLPGGSRLSDPIRKCARDFGGEDLSWLYEYLEKTAEPGIYQVRIENAVPGTRRFILCDERFPNRLGPESIYDFYEEGLNRIAV